jgi:hypothetical protein
MLIPDESFSDDFKSLSPIDYCANLKWIFSHNKADFDGKALCLGEESNAVRRKKTRKGA